MPFLTFNITYDTKNYKSKILGINFHKFTKELQRKCIHFAEIIANIISDIGVIVSKTNRFSPNQRTLIKNKILVL